MAMRVRSAVPLSVGQAEALLPLATVKQALRIDGVAEDTILAAYRLAAIDWCERFTGKAVVSRSFAATWDRFAPALRLPREPVSAVTAVSHLDTGSATVALDESDWRLAGDVLMPGVGTVWPAVLAGEGAVSVTFTAGFADAPAEAPGLIAAMLLVIGNLHANREATISGTSIAEVPFGAALLAEQYRSPVIG